MSDQKILHWTESLRKKSQEMGFDSIGYARAEKMDPEAKRLEKWLNMGNHGKMSWMENHFDLRVDPTKLVPGAKSVISLAYNYYNPIKQSDPEAPKISMYAYGEDYHKVIRKKLKELLQWISTEIGEVSGRCFVDSAPVLERDWARRSGIAWSGKNTLSINPKNGSYFFLAHLILDLELEYDHPIKDYCGTCNRCVEACPTDAFAADGYLLDATKCISYLTIELKDEIPSEFEGKMNQYVFGCDICQEVCPWNRFSKPHKEPAFEPSEHFINMSKSDWLEITDDVFEQLFKNSPLKRAKYEGLKRNIRFLNKPHDNK